MSDWSEIDREYLMSLKDRHDPETFRKLYMQEPVVDRDYLTSLESIVDPMPEVYWFFAPDFRIARDVLRVEFEIDPRMPIIKIVTGRMDQLYSTKREATVTMIDPRHKLRHRDLVEFDAISRYRKWREWDRRDRDYLRYLSRRGPG